ncbi:L-histidine N(alpha)-methyltransferase [Aquabacterium sp. CECT 9606]|uniref:L-histidine N(alpha)-methyltransferase n=1 Tax=Aquabacterium sp. CECT 9606 TaxID=2845822 RepID=UPI001E5217BD|nr:L-histidine N(alpha)-methyltransferase [Aquabacterium sp. CECT 9606]CAH0354954.1 Histidine N-alpha-methyltransferase [Aquabacterium sp. CECT 9606]
MALSTAPTAAQADAFATDVYGGLTQSPQKTLPSKYLYDAVGSALFEVITHLPEYGLTRADERLIKANAQDILARTGPVRTVVELGSGSGRKTRWVLEACARHQPCTYYPIEISATALAQCGRELSDIAGVKVLGIEREYLPGLQQITAMRQGESPMLVLFLGSTIGNFARPDAQRFLGDVRKMMRPGDALLLGTDLVKPTQTLVSAYDDALGVTAAFNLNLLVRMNRELSAGFDLKQFEHEARFNPQASAIEMHIRSRVKQSVEIPGAGLTVEFEAGDTIWTEISRKYLAPDVLAMGAQAGFTSGGQWIDEDWPFAETLLIAA